MHVEVTKCPMKGGRFCQNRRHRGPKTTSTDILAKHPSPEPHPVGPNTFIPATT